jgi:hypothetical protein
MLLRPTALQVLLREPVRSRAHANFDARTFPGKRLHVRAIVRDGRRAFVGSQSLRKVELDERREVGIIIRD